MFKADKADPSDPKTVDQLRSERSGQDIGQDIWIYLVVHQDSTVDDAFDYGDSHEISFRSSDRILSPALTDPELAFFDLQRSIESETSRTTARQFLSFLGSRYSKGVFA